MYLKKIRTKIKCFRSDQSSDRTKKQPHIATHGKSITTCPSFQRQRILKNIYTQQTIEEFSKAYFAAGNQKGTESANGMMRLLSSGHLSF